MGCSQSAPQAVVAPPPSSGDRAVPSKTVAPMTGNGIQGRNAQNAGAQHKAKPSDASTSSSYSNGNAVKGGGGGGGHRASSPPPPGAVASSEDCASSSGSTGGHHLHTGYSSGASTPVDDRSLDGNRSLDGSRHGHRRSVGGAGCELTSSGNPKNLMHSNSVLGLDKMIEDRKGDGDLKSNVVHIEVPFGKPIEEVYDGVHDGPVLGSGISGLVRLISHKNTGVKYAVKCLDLGLVETEEGLQQLREEIYIMCQLDHPNIVRLEEVYESFNEIYLVQELCLGGELFDRLDEQPDYHYTESQCARLVKQMLCAVRYIHSKGIIHRDLKLENFLFSSTSPESELKMIDFGLSKHFKFGEVQHEAVGTPYTVAPEVIRGSYDERCDVWAIGVISFLLLSGDPPFGGCGGPEPLMQVRENILRGKFEFEPEDVWENVSTQAKDYIKKLLVTDPNRRPTAKEAQRSAWLKEWANRDRKHEDKRLNPNVVRALVNFKEFSDMRKLLCEVLSFTLLPDQIEDLRREFEKLDTDGSGEISLHGLKQVLISNAGAGSLGALTEEEVEDIFNAMRVRKTETRIHWHEFIAAGLSQCKVDERNLKLAFDRLDADHKGYITYENVTDLLGNDPSHSEDAMRRMWGDSMKAYNCKQARITYEDFLLLMKGQTRQDDATLCALGPGGSSSSVLVGSMEAGSSSSLGLGLGLGVVHEVHESALSEESRSDGTSGGGGGAAGGLEAPAAAAAGGGDIIVLPSGDVVAKGDGAISAATGSSAVIARRRSSLVSQASSTGGPVAVAPQGRRSSHGSGTGGELVPPSPTLRGPAAKSLPNFDEDLSDGPLMMDEEDDIDEKLSKAADARMLGLSELGLVENNNNVNLTPPQSPRRGAVDYITPISQREKLSPVSMEGAPIIPGDISGPEGHPRLIRLRSRSVDDQDSSQRIVPGGVGGIMAKSGSEDQGEQSPSFARDVRRAMLLPEHNHNAAPDIEKAIKDETMTPLVVNRKLYRAHRQMRLSVMEASKRFEEQQIARAKKMLEKRGGQPCGAGLTMRHGHVRDVSLEAIREHLKNQQKQQDTQVNKANKRGGRGRRTRKKTVSDMAGMLGSSPPAEIIMNPDPASSSAPKDNAPHIQEVSETNPVQRGSTDSSVPPAPIEPLRKPTTPGVFRKTVDPFAEFTGRKMLGMESASGANSIMLHGEQGLMELAAISEGQGSSSNFSALKSSLVAQKDLPALPIEEASAAADDTMAAADVSVRSMRSSASDGNLKKMDLEAPSPQSSVDQPKNNDGEANSWPPPPPL